MNQALSSFQAAPEAREAAKILREEVEIQRTVLEETIQSAEQGQVKEAGRTLCGPNAVRRPIQRLPRSIKLQRCPVGATAIIHTHPSMAELRNPHHSLPDVANVLFEVDASMVVGTDSSEIITRADDVDAMHREFENAIGLTVDSTQEVTAAVRDNRIPDPPAARDRVREALGGLVSRESMSFSDLSAEIDDLNIPARSISAACLTGHGHTQTVATNAPTSFHQQQSEVVANIRATVRNFMSR